MKWSEYYEKCPEWQESTQYNRLSSITDFGPETSPSSEITDCLQYVDERTAKRIIKMALNSGVRFLGSEIADIVEYCIQDEDVLKPLIETSDDSTYTAETLERIVSSLFDETLAVQLIKRICRKPNYFKDTEIVSLCESFYEEEAIKILLLTNKTKFSIEAIDSLREMWVDEEVLRKVCERSGISYPDSYEEETDMEEDYSVGYAEPVPRIGLGFFGVLAELVGGAIGQPRDRRKKHSGHCEGDCANCPPHYGYRYGRYYYGRCHQYGCQFGGNCGNGRYD